MDFADFDSKAVAERGVVMELINPVSKDTWVDDDGKAYWIRLLGLDSDKLRKAANKSIERTVNDARRGKQTEFDAEEARADKARLYATATIEWYIPSVDGQPLECNEKNARKLYSDPRFPWLAELIDKQINDRASFFRQASPSS